MVCWWCYWGWPKEIADIYAGAAAKIGDYPLRYGPSHVVWEDENWELAQSCIKDCDDFTDFDGISKEDIAVIRESLVRLAELPDEFKRTPEGYEDDDPEAFPPPSHWVMVKE